MPDSVTYKTKDPGIFIIPTQIMPFASKEQVKNILKSLLSQTINQVYTLAKNSYFHTSLAYLSHNMNIKNQNNRWVGYRGGDIADVKKGLGHVNFRPGTGLVDAEHAESIVTASRINAIQKVY